MTPDRVAAIVSGAVLLLFLAWFFFGKRRDLVAVSSATIVVDGGYAPDWILAKQGMPLTLTFDRRDSGPCTDEIVLPDFGVRRSLPTGQKTTITVVPQHAGEFPFSCGMSMLHGKIRVEP